MYVKVNPRLHVTAVDFSSRAVSLLKLASQSTSALSDIESSPPPQIEQTPLSSRINVYQCDIVREALPLDVCPSSQDFVLCMFVLSAIHPQHHVAVIRKLTKALKPGGKLLFRDYGR
jgi:methyltransferase-like protein 6